MNVVVVGRLPHAAHVIRVLLQGCDAGQPRPRVLFVQSPVESAGHEDRDVYCDPRNDLEALGVRVVTAAAAGIESGVLVADGRCFDADVVIAAGAVRAPAWLYASTLALDTEGFVKAQADGTSVSHRDVWIGPGLGTDAQRFANENAAKQDAVARQRARDALAFITRPIHVMGVAHSATSSARSRLRRPLVESVAKVRAWHRS